MKEIRISIPEELKELAYASKINWQLAVERKLKEELEKIQEIKYTLSKSKITRKEVDKLADEVNWALSKRYEDLAKEE